MALFTSERLNVPREKWLDEKTMKLGPIFSTASGPEWSGLGYGLLSSLYVFLIATQNPLEKANTDLSQSQKMAHSQ